MELKKIRPAKPEDAKTIAPLLIQAMEDLVCKLVGSSQPLDAIPLFEHFISIEQNQYSYKNCLVYEEDKTVVGTICGYDGGKLAELRDPVLQFIKERYGVEHRSLERETEAGEFYLDTVSVAPAQQGKGIGKALISALMTEAGLKGYERVGLIVEEGNQIAKSLYLKLGFESAGFKTIAGGSYEHLVYKFPGKTSLEA